MGLNVSGPYRYPPPAPEWLALRVEDVIEPDLPIIDAHHHLWDEGGVPYLLREIMADAASGHRIDATVFVQAHYGYRPSGPAHLAPVGETEKVAAISAAAGAQGATTDIAAAIVAYADLTLGDAVDEVLEAHAAAANGALRGIRHSVSRDPLFPDGIVIRPAPAQLLADSRYRAGLARLCAHGLVYDAMLYNCQLSELTVMARALPRLPIVLDHIGCVIGVGPHEGQEAAIFQRWLADMTELARCPNVTVKLGGMGMIVCGARWHERPEPPGSQELADAWRPWFESCIDLFGADRCMFESNFPVDKAMYSYRTLWNAFKRIASGASAQEKHDLFAGTAARTYGITAKAPTRPAETLHG
ncbi:amidohydrolase family protein [Sphingobium sp.]|uniref:amidohydrolase family protein n=1 Tax=Sphingobium sp. TaxID=1912891 RepID=UPI0028BE60CA|nr:amidohydrolase family protein [Sphingobium sp.]